MDVSENEELIEARQKRLEKERKGLMWSPRGIDKLTQYYNWLSKQANQREKTLLLDGVTHSKARRAELRADMKAYAEKAKEIKDKIEDGGR
jgi:hypothetical protein